MWIWIKERKERSSFNPAVLGAEGRKKKKQHNEQQKNQLLSFVDILKLILDRIAEIFINGIPDPLQANQEKNSDEILPHLFCGLTETMNQN